MEKLIEYIKDGLSEETVSQVKKLVDEGVNAELILKNALIAAMNEVGDLFQKGEYYLPEMMIAARAMQQGLDVIKPLLVETDHEPVGRVIIGTVSGDMHDIGKNLVIMSLEGAGFEVIDLGVDVSPDKFVEAIREYKPDILGLSALLTTTLIYMKKTIEAIKDAGLKEVIKVMVGGAPVTQDFADEIGADFYGADINEGKNYACKVIEQRK